MGAREHLLALTLAAFVVQTAVADHGSPGPPTAGPPVVLEDLVGQGYRLVYVEATDRRAFVSDLQSALVKQGHPIAVDGLLGPRTLEAWMRYQQSRGRGLAAVSVLAFGLSSLDVAGGRSRERKAFRAALRQEYERTVRTLCEKESPRQSLKQKTVRSHHQLPHDEEPRRIGEAALLLALFRSMPDDLNLIPQDGECLQSVSESTKQLIRLAAEALVRERSVRIMGRGR